MPAGARLARKVPEVTLYFWIIKLLTTAMGESTSDYLVYRIDPVVAVVLGAMALVAALALQLVVRRYIAWVYWLAVVMVAVFGTMAADVLHIRLHVPYDVSTALFGVSLVIIFVVWYRTERTLSIHSITTPRRELFYWATVLATFALGTAAGDMTAVTLHLGYLTSAVVFTIVIAVPAVAYYTVHLNEIVAFWFAYIITRPVGASFADWMGVAHRLGGLNMGRATVSAILTVLIVALVGYLTVTRLDVADAAVAAAAAP
ncbi:MAG TPA: hypothetical protein VN799_00270 [Acidimicrobiales bacterium]|nr:hypothetical protein [Acidimicrobiales bacterium]